MKLFKKILIGFFIACVLSLIAGVVFVKNLDINQYKHIFEEAIKTNLNKDVTISHISYGFSWNDGVTVKLKDVVLDDKRSHPSTLVSVQTISLGVDVKRFVKDRLIIVSDVVIDKPEILVVQTQKSSVEEEMDISQIKAKPSQGVPAEEKKSVGVQDLVIKTIHINDGSLVFDDQTEDGLGKININNINLDLQEFRFNEFFDFNLKFGLFGNKENMFVEGSALFEEKMEDVVLKEIKIKSNIADIDIKQAARENKLLEPLNQLTQVAGVVEVDIESFKFSQGKISNSVIKGSLANGRIVSKNIPKPLEDINIVFNVSDDVILFKRINARYENGGIGLTGEIKDYLSLSQQDFSLMVDQIQIHEFLAAQDIPVEILGLLKLRLDGQFSGLSVDDIEKTLTGGGSVYISEGVLKDINVLKIVLNKISFIPNLAQKLEEKLPPEYKEKLKQVDTPLNLVKVDFKAVDQRIVFNRGEVDADGFVVSFNGSMDFKQNIHFVSGIHIPVELSGLIVDSVEEMAAFLDQKGRIYIPLKPYDGPVDEFVIYPDTDHIMTQAIQERGRMELQKVLNKALGIDDNSEALEGDATDQENPQTRPKPPEQQAVEGLLDLIFN